jgi:hypothetical protein
MTSSEILPMTIEPMTDSKFCEHCGAQFFRQRKRSLCKWGTRRYCGESCSKAAAKVGRPARDLSSNPLLTYLELPVMPGECLSPANIACLLGVSEDRVSAIEGAVLKRWQEMRAGKGY